jgi:hypothetical protein
MGENQGKGDRGIGVNAKTQKTKEERIEYVWRIAGTKGKRSPLICTNNHE